MRRNQRIMSLLLSVPRSRRRSRFEAAALAVRAVRRAVARFVRLCYTMWRSVAMGGKIPIAESERGSKNISTLCKWSVAPRGISYPFTRRSFS